MTDSELARAFKVVLERKRAAGLPEAIEGGAMVDDHLGMYAGTGLDPREVERVALGLGPEILAMLEFNRPVEVGAGLWADGVVVGVEVGEARHRRGPGDRLERAFAELNAGERQLLTCALAGNHPPHLAPFRMPVLRALAKADRAARGEADHG